MSRRILVGPLAIVFFRTFENGFDAAWAALSAPETVNAFKLTLLITAIAVPANSIPARAATPASEFLDNDM